MMSNEFHSLSLIETCFKWLIESDREYSRVQCKPCLECIVGSPNRRTHELDFLLQTTKMTHSEQRTHWLKEGAIGLTGNYIYELYSTVWWVCYTDMRVQLVLSVYLPYPSQCFSGYPVWHNKCHGWPPFGHYKDENAGTERIWEH